MSLWKEVKISPLRELLRRGGVRPVWMDAQSRPRDHRGLRPNEEQFCLCLFGLTIWEPMQVKGRHSRKSLFFLLLLCCLFVFYFCFSAPTIKTNQGLGYRWWQQLGFGSFFPNICVLSCVVLWWTRSLRSFHAPLPPPVRCPCRHKGAEEGAEGERL